MKVRSLITVKLHKHIFIVGTKPGEAEVTVKGFILIICSYAQSAGINCIPGSTFAGCFFSVPFWLTAAVQMFNDGFQS